MGGLRSTRACAFWACVVLGPERAADAKLDFPVGIVSRSRSAGGVSEDPSLTKGCVCKLNCCRCALCHCTFAAAGVRGALVMLDALAPSTWTHGSCESCAKSQNC